MPAWITLIGVPLYYVNLPDLPAAVAGFAIAQRLHSRTRLREDLGKIVLIKCQSIGAIPESFDLHIGGLIYRIKVVIVDLPSSYTCRWSSGEEDKGTCGRFSSSSSTFPSIAPSTSHLPTASPPPLLPPPQPPSTTPTLSPHIPKALPPPLSSHIFTPSTPPPPPSSSLSPVTTKLSSFVSPICPPDLDALQLDASRFRLHLLAHRPPLPPSSNKRHIPQFCHKAATISADLLLRSPFSAVFDPMIFELG